MNKVHVTALLISIFLPASSAKITHYIDSMGYFQESEKLAWNLNSATSCYFTTSFSTERVSGDDLTSLTYSLSSD
ncbi:hypothetical protein EIJ81_20950 [Aliivibrio salmonicida]|jgi:hypothetical protein|uniref:Exported protein n=1 Tax=Aliivibrio salmonicida (strain LFI1238) TaxID=316275 RepID=B6ERV1_ALISL|nr:hypothetical protein [Aliivibrio salmonicida]AZL86781.1 hypothetical protein EIJ81_20950 [Aliivibrio salmonicida]CAQ81435.1 putative exported protein [Aliivibrio salmonicida LFI1238]